MAGFVAVHTGTELIGNRSIVFFNNIFLIGIWKKVREISWMTLNIRRYAKSHV